MMRAAPQHPKSQRFARLTPSRVREGVFHFLYEVKSRASRLNTISADTRPSGTSTGESMVAAHTFPVAVLGRSLASSGIDPSPGACRFVDLVGRSFQSLFRDRMADAALGMTVRSLTLSRQILR